MPDIDPVSFVLALLPYPLMKGRTIADFKIHGWSWQFAAPHWPMQILQAQSRRLHAEIEGCVPGNVALHLPLFHNGFCRRLVLLRSAAAPGAAAAAAGRRLSARRLLVFERVISLDKCPVGCGVFLVNLGELPQNPNLRSGAQ